jgi:hypothetical protein
MASLCNRALDAAYILFGGEAGLKISLENLSEETGREIEIAAFVLERRMWGSKWNDRDAQTRLPRVSFSLARLKSKGAEKLSRNAASATLQVEIAASGEKPEQVSEEISNYIDGVIDVLDRNRGLWAAGVFYAGEFEVDIKALAKGGLNYTQSAVFEIEVYLWHEI